MQDLSPAEIEALAKAMGKTSPTASSHEAHSSTPYGTKPTHHESTHPISHAQFSQLHESSSGGDLPLQYFDTLPIHLEAILGRTKISLKDLMQFHTGTVISLDKLAGELIDIEANGKLIARGEVVVVDENYGIKILEIIE